MENQTIQNPIQREIPNQPSKRFPILSIVLVFISVLLLLSTAFLAYQNIQLKKQVVSLRSTPSPTSVVTIDPTVVWKTYTNTKYGFLLKYPNEYVISNEDPSGQSVYFVPKNYESLPEQDKYNSPTINVNVLSSSSANGQNTPKTFVDSAKAPGFGNKRDIVAKTVAGQSAMQFMSNNTQAGSGRDEINTVIQLPKSNTLVLITVATEGNGDPYNLPNQILSTFKFPNSPKNTITVKLYYYDSKLDPNTDFCEANNYTEKDMPKTNTPIKDAINNLIRSDIFEKDDRFILKSINLKQDGTLMLEFPWIGGFTTGGSCRIGILTSQIEKTALQFSEVKKVTFEPEVFQP